MSVDIRKEQAETILAKANELYETGEFVAPPSKGVGKNEYEFGEATAYEKALYSARNFIKDQAKAMRTEMRAGKEKVNEKRLFLYKQKYAALDNLLWASIDYRLPNEFKDVGIRADWKIVGFDQNGKAPGFFAKRKAKKLAKKTLPAGNDLYQAQEETILKMVNDVLAKDEFVLPDQETGENEKILGEMTTYEKAILSACAIIAEKHNAMIKRSDARDHKEELLSNQVNHEILNDLLWVTIRHRLVEVCEKFDNFGLRSDGKIYAIEESEDMIIKALKDILGLKIIDDSDDDQKIKCADCPDYDTCNLLKKVMIQPAANETIN